MLMFKVPKYARYNNVTVITAHVTPRKFKHRSSKKKRKCKLLPCHKKLQRWYLKRKAIRELKKEIKAEKRRQQVWRQWRGEQERKISQSALKELRKQRLSELTDQLAELERIKDDLGEETYETGFGQTEYVEDYTTKNKKSKANAIVYDEPVLEEYTETPFNRIKAKREKKRAKKLKKEIKTYEEYFYPSKKEKSKKCFRKVFGICKKKQKNIEEPKYEEDSTDLFSESDYEEIFDYKPTPVETKKHVEKGKKSKKEIIEIKEYYEPERYEEPVRLTKKERKSKLHKNSMPVSCHRCNMCNAVYPQKTKTKKTITKEKRLRSRRRAKDPNILVTERYSGETISEKFVNRCYRLCCELYCWITCILIVGLTVFALI